MEPSAGAGVPVTVAGAPAAGGHTTPLPHRAGRWWDRSPVAVPESLLGHEMTARQALVPEGLAGSSRQSRYVHGRS
ncbi:hypothetical protein JD79_03401 [Geodermatophilus normandii]|uniref:Uncharacterized protein n=1 Tax=Geodermatophilus normandii TaxID=1137989 RepID=A0A317QMP1_9ACTN|nr:hypothetical protein JD79_03401 [Geodermatophilus normandii]